MDERLLTKLADSFDDMKERLIRIEENVKGFSSVKEELEVTKIELAQVKENGRSSHKRIDSLELTLKEKENDIKWLKRQFITSSIGFGFTILAAIVIAAIKFNQ
jgi:hypothetical protein